MTDQRSEAEKAEQQAEILDDLVFYGLPSVIRDNHVIQMDTLLVGTAFDSLDAIEIVLWAKEEYRILLTEDDIMGFETYGDIVREIDRLITYQGWSLL